VAAFEELYRRIGHAFARRELLELAVTHRSAAPRRDGRILANERLEFLGDRVLGLVIAELLLDRHAEEDEGQLSRRLHALVRREALARVGLAIGVNQALKLSKGEVGGGGRENMNLIADACEAVIGALFLDGGLLAASAFIHREWAPLIRENTEPSKDARTTLQEAVQAAGKPLPVYRTVGSEGPDHAPSFVVEVAVEGVEPVHAEGRSKQAASEAAAAAMLARLGGG
jgi:ribonuclease-3